MDVEVEEVISQVVTAGMEEGTVVMLITMEDMELMERVMEVTVVMEGVMLGMVAMEVVMNNNQYVVKEGGSGTLHIRSR